MSVRQFAVSSFTAVALGTLAGGCATAPIAPKGDCVGGEKKELLVFRSEKTEFLEKCAQYETGKALIQPGNSKAAQTVGHNILKGVIPGYGAAIDDAAVRNAIKGEQQVECTAFNVSGGGFDFRCTPVSSQPAKTPVPTPTTLDKLSMHHGVSPGFKLTGPAFNFA